MRKCPNCHKNVPAGAKRCVYCRSLVEKEKVSSQPRPEEVELDAASHTMLGVANSAIRSGDRNKRSDDVSDDYGDENNHTLLGFGAGMRLGDEREQRVDDSKDKMQETMLGMPGVSAVARDIEVGSGVLGLNRPVMRGKHSDPVGGVASSKGKLGSSEPSGDDFDPLAGLVGVSPKVSSLIDEEFDDISTDVLGFNLDDADLEDTDNDWLDIEPIGVGSMTIKSQEMPKVSEDSKRIVVSEMAADDAQASDDQVLELETKPSEEVGIVSESKQSESVSGLDGLDEPVGGERKTVEEDVIFNASTPTIDLKPQARSSFPWPETLSYLSAIAVVSALLIPMAGVIPLTTLSAKSHPLNLIFVAFALFSIAAVIFATRVLQSKFFQALIVMLLCVLLLGVISVVPWASVMPHRAILYGAFGGYVVATLAFVFKS